MTAPGRTVGFWEVCRAVGSLAEQPADRVADALSLPTPLDPADHTHVFAFSALPYASAYLGADGMLGGETAARVAGFWEAVGYQPPDPPDHLAALLDLRATLGEREDATGDPARQALVQQAGSALMWEHILPWSGVFTDVVRAARVKPWDHWADLLDEVLSQNRQPDGSPLPRHLQDAPPALDSDFQPAHLLVPLRTGMVVTRSDLVAAARALGLGTRLTGRLPTLQALLGQSPRPMLEWLSAHAGGWERLHNDRGATTLIDRFWAKRAANTTAVLDAIGTET